MSRAWLTLLRAPRLGARSVLDLLESEGDVGAILEAGADRLRQAGLDAASVSAIVRPDKAAIDSDLEWLEGEGRHLVPLDDDDYPPLLLRTASPPLALFVVGDPAILWQPQISVVGSRNPTPGGLDHARAFSAELARQGLVITSGLASGIDSAAHQAALDVGGRTIAVTGTGLDRVYPTASQALAETIPGAGAMVSEFPPGTPPRRHHFPARNRIIAGLSLGVLVVEAGVNSGSLITARLAAEQGREVFALPGSLHNPMVKGCHRLIKQGARLAESTGDILEELGPMAGELATQLRQRLARPDTRKADAGGSTESELLSDPDYARLWEVIGFDPEPVDRLIDRSGLEARAVSSMLLMLDLHGLVEYQAGGRVCRRR